MNTDIHVKKTHGYSDVLWLTQPKSLAKYCNILQLILIMNSSITKIL